MPSQRISGVNMWAKPLTALQGLDTTGRVIYVSTFNQVLFPALHLGYLVVLHDLIDAFLAACLFADMHPS